MNIFPYPELHECEYKNGVFVCPVCGKTIQFNPYKVLVQGDINAVHRGGTIGIQIAGTAVSTLPLE